MAQDPRPVIVSGPSGVGKGTLISKLLERHPGTFVTTISHTTRPPRPGEIDGETYHFVSSDDFESLVQANGFLEHTVFSNNRYGTSKKTIEEQSAKGKVFILDIEMNGLAKIKSHFDVRSVFISPPNLQELQSRLEGRATESHDSIQRRVRQASIEMENARKPGVHDKIIINNDLDKACNELEQWILGQHGQS